MEITVVNWTPFTYSELKPGQIPDTYIIPPATNEEKIPGVLHVVNAHSNLYIPLQEYTFTVPIAADMLANDLVRALVSAKICYELDVAEPAIYTLDGHLSSSAVSNPPYGQKRDAAFAKQHMWLQRLVKMADDDWQRFRQHKFITDLQRWAARKLGLKKEWEAVSSATPLEFEDCKFCGVKTLKNMVVCHNCKNILDPVRYKELSSVKVS